MQSVSVAHLQASVGARMTQVIEPPCVRPWSLCSLPLQFGGPHVAALQLEDPQRHRPLLSVTTREIRIARRILLQCWSQIYTVPLLSRLQEFDLARYFIKLYFHCSLFSCHTLVAMVKWQLYSVCADPNMLTVRSGKLRPSQVNARTTNYSKN